MKRIEFNEIVTEEEPLVGRVLKLTHGRGFDLAIDAISGPIMQALSEAAAHEAKLVVYGVLDPNPVDFPLYPALTKGISMTGFHYVFHLLEQPERRQRMIDFLEKALQ
ncbi:MAG: zinc-binding dehydrogenase [Bacteroidota bacterium]